MNAQPAPTRPAPVSPPPEHLVGHFDTAQAALPLAAEGVVRYVWRSRYGDMLIEARGGEVYVNGQRVEPAAAWLRKAGPGAGDQDGA